MRRAGVEKLRFRGAHEVVAVAVCLVLGAAAFHLIHQHRHQFGTFYHDDLVF